VTRNAALSDHRLHNICSRVVALKNKFEIVTKIFTKNLPHLFLKTAHFRPETKS